MEANTPDYLKQNNKFIQSSVRVDKSVNRAGSTAGAGSGDFHQYRQLRRKERYRLVKMEAEVRQQVAEQEYAAEREDRRLETEVKTLGKALKRQKKKEAKRQWKINGGPPEKPEERKEEPTLGKRVKPAEEVVREVSPEPEPAPASESEQEVPCEEGENSFSDPDEVKLNL